MTRSILNTNSEKSTKTDKKGVNDNEDEDFIREIDSNQKYTQITPVRDQVNSETVKRELYGLHRYGDGRKFPLDFEQIIPGVQPVNNFEFLIYKPPGEPQFKFLFGTGDNGQVDVERLESTTRSQYPEDFDFSTVEFDITEVFDGVPHMVRYDGVEERRKDWMTTLTMFDTEEIDRSPLSNLLETAIQCDGAVIFQVVFEPRADWTPKAERQKGRLQRGVNTTAGLVAQTVVDALMGGATDEERQERHRGDTPREVGGTIHDTQTDGPRHGTSRMGQIDLKDPNHTYNVTLRAAAPSEEVAKNLTDSLNHLSGKFYSVEGQYVKHQEREYKRMLNHELTRPNGWEAMTRRKAMLVTNIDELANFITVPSIDALPKASRGGTGGTAQAQSPLTSPNEEVFRQFSNGMTIGTCVTALRKERNKKAQVDALRSRNKWRNMLDEREAIGLSATDLTHHYLRAATTGSGKTVATINDMLSAYENLNGPIILVDPKDGDMCENYLRSHRAIFGDLNDVEYIKVPEKDGQIPGIPFFDIRPLTRGAGEERDAAKQSIIDHYFQLLRFVLGRDTVEQAFVANEILTNLIKAKFDEEHGSDYFTIGDLMKTAQEFQKHGRQVENTSESPEKVEQAIPKTEDAQVRSILESHLEKEKRQFVNTTDAVLNRIRKLKERDFIWDMLSFQLDEDHWDEETGWYDNRDVPMLDLKNILNENKVLILDTGSLRGESSEVFTVLFLSHLWTAAKTQWTPDAEDYIANVIIEESANIARNEIVYNELLPKGREFNLSLGLIMQYPEQVLGEDPRRNKRAYKEILNNVNTKIIGNIATDDLLADSLFHEDLDRDEIKDRISGLRRGDWVVQLPSTGFHEEKPEILTLKPLPIPPGHDAGNFTISPETHSVRERSRRLHCVSRDHDAIDCKSGTSILDDDDDDEDNAEGEDGEDSDSTTLTREHLSFLDIVFDALTDNIDSYSAADSMKTLPFSDVADDLVDGGYLEVVKLGQGGSTYYEPTKKAEIEVDRDLSMDGDGEYGNESLQHRIGCLVTAEHYRKQGYDAEIYHSPTGAAEKYDVYATATEDSPDDNDKCVEVEMSPEKRGHVYEDLKNLFLAEGDSVWVVENYEGAEHLLRHFRGQLDSVPNKSIQNFEKMSEQLDGQGADEILSLSNLRSSSSG